MDALDSIIDMLEREPTFEERLTHLENLAHDGLHPRDCGEYRDARYDVMRAHKDTDIGKKDAEISALRAQLAAAEERARRSQLALESLTPGGSEYAGVSDRCVAFVRESREGQHRVILDKSHQLASARADAVREFAEWLDGKDDRKIWEPNSSPGIKYTISEAVLFYLHERGVPSARPDDGRVERAKMEINCILYRLEVVARFGDADTIAVLAAADGAERGGR